MSEVQNMTEDEIRRDERRQLADLLEGNTSTITGFAKDPASIVGVIVLLLRLGATPDVSLAIMADGNATNSREPAPDSPREGGDE